MANVWGQVDYHRNQFEQNRLRRIRENNERVKLLFESIVKVFAGLSRETRVEPSDELRMRFRMIFDDAPLMNIYSVYYQLCVFYERRWPPGQTRALIQSLFLPCFEDQHRVLSAQLTDGLVGLDLLETHFMEVFASRLHVEANEWQDRLFHIDIWLANDRWQATFLDIPVIDPWFFTLITMIEYNGVYERDFDPLIARFDGILNFLLQREFYTNCYANAFGLQNVFYLQKTLTKLWVRGNNILRDHMQNMFMSSIEEMIEQDVVPDLRDDFHAYVQGGIDKEFPPVGNWYHLALSLFLVRLLTRRNNHWDIGTTQSCLVFSRPSTGESIVITRMRINTVRRTNISQYVILATTSADGHIHDATFPELPTIIIQHNDRDEIGAPIFNSKDHLEPINFINRLFANGWVLTGMREPESEDTRDVFIANTCRNCKQESPRYQCCDIGRYCSVECQRQDWDKSHSKSNLH